MQHTTIELIALKRLGESCVFPDLRKLAADIAAGAEASFDIRHHSKTQLQIIFNLNEFRLDAGCAVASFKTQAQTTPVFLESGQQQRHYFKLSKTQGEAELKQYLKAVLANIEQLVGAPFQQTRFKAFGLINFI